MPAKGQRTPAYDRVMAKCVRRGACLVYTGGLNVWGYGQAWRDGKNVSAHKVVWEHHNGVLPDGFEIDHVAAKGCVSRACCEIAHLELVTQVENARRRRKQVCRNGHTITGPNEAFVGARRRRRCRACDVERTRRWRERKAA